VSFSSGEGLVADVEVELRIVEQVLLANTTLLHSHRKIPLTSTPQLAMAKAREIKSAAGPSLLTFWTDLAIQEGMR
jgi:hypothetical protein